MIDPTSTPATASEPPTRQPARLTTGLRPGVAAAALIPALILGFFLVRWLVPHQGPNPIAGVILAQPGIVSSPSSLLSADDRRSLASMTNDGSLFGMPMAVRIVRVSEPMTQPETQAAAEQYFKETPIETGDGAGNGLLFYIAVPQDQPKASTAAFVPGANFFPQQGLTQERLDRTLSEIIQPRLAAGNYADAAKQGAAWIVYDQLFGTMPRVPLSHGQQVLNHLANLAFAPIIGVLAAGYLALAWWTRRAAHRNHGNPAAPVRSPYTAAAIARGRADDALSTAAMLDLFARGNLRLTANRRGIEPGTTPDTDDPFASAIWQRVADLSERSGGSLPMSAVSRIDDAFPTQLSSIRARMTSDGQFSSRIPALNRLVWATGTGLLLLVTYALVPSLVSRAAAGFLVAMVVLPIVAGVTWWTFHRSRSTEAGTHEAGVWLAAQREAAQAGDEEAIAALRLYRLIVDQEALIEDRATIAEEFGSQAPQFMARIRGMSIA